MKQFCKISVWLQQHDPDLLEIINNLCMLGNLSAAKYKHGVTFIYPKQAKIRDEIKKHAYSNDPSQAIKTLESLILPFYIPTPAEFTGEIGSYTGVKLEVEKTEANKVILKNGEAVLVPAADFKPFPDRRLAVWIMESGSMPLEGPPISGKRRVGGMTRRFLSISRRILRARVLPLRWKRPLMTVCVKTGVVSIIPILPSRSPCCLSCRSTIPPSLLRYCRL